MLDIKFIRENLELVKEGARKKRFNIDFDALISLDDERRQLQTSVDGMRATRNAMSQKIKNLSGEERNAAIAETRQLGEELSTAEAKLKDVEQKFYNLMNEVPNVPDADVPEGRDDSENVEIRHWGEIPQFGFEPKDHADLGKALDILDIERGVKLAGSRSYFLKNEGAQLEWAVMMYAMDMMVKKGFTPMIVPMLVKDKAMTGTGYFPGGEEQAYRCERDELNLVGTAEVSLTSYYMDEILNEADLPKYLVGMSSCFRREAGTYGKDTKGVYRVHQFTKIEQVVICKADDEVSAREHEHITKNAEDLLQALKIPYRVVAVCSGDLGKPQAKKYDIEAWMPSRGNYGETHSASKFYEFQARRLNLRYKDSDGKTKFTHTLNNTVVASPRILIAIIENYQNEDGTITIPEVLRPYMGGKELIKR